MNYYTEVFDDKLHCIEMYQSYPRFKPFVGSDYGTVGPRILLIAESHYLPSESTVHINAESWYSSKEDKLTSKEQRWIHTRGLLNKPLKGWQAKGHAIYRHLESALLKAGLPANDSVFRQIAFMNAFQRPAKTGVSIKSTNQDIEIAAATINQVIEALQPDYVAFVSTKAKRALSKRLNHKSVGFHHPASPWWNRKQNKISSKERFIDLISEFWIAKRTDQ